MSKWGAVNYRDLQKLQKRMEQLESADLDAFYKAMAKELAARLLAKVRKRTPVGKKPKFEGKKTEKVKGKYGKTQSFLTADKIRYDKYWSGYSGGNLRNSWTIDFDIVKVGDEYEITVINTAEYASYVEFGHRQTVGRYVPALGKKLKKGWVKGHFMMTESEVELESQAPKILEKKLERLLKDALING